MILSVVIVTAVISLFVFCPTSPVNPYVKSSTIQEHNAAIIVPPWFYDIW